MKPSEFLEKTLAVMDNDGWCQRFARSAKPGGYRYCIIGAKVETAKSCAWHLSPRCSREATDMLYKVAGCYDLTLWNDAPGRTFADVRELFEKSISALREKGQ